MIDDHPDPGLPEPPVNDGPGLFGEPAPAKTPAAPAKPYRVLARAYRPTRFDDLIGQDAMVRILRRAFELGRVAHAFMLTGVRGVGKTTSARIIARALNCIGADGNGGPTADPCGVCPNCVAILADRHPDVLEMDAASRTGIDDVREIIEATRFRPMQARMKVFIVDEVHMLSKPAFNALLKTLEEPPSQVTFIFATTELRKVPVTVLSRCQRFDLRRVSINELSTHFARIAAKEGAAISADALALISRAADGSVRDGLSLLDQAIAQGPGGNAGRDPSRDQGAEAAGGGGGREIGAAQVADMLGLADRGLVFDLLDAVMGGRADTALGITDQAHARGADLGQMLADLLELIHTVSRLKSIPALRDSNELPEAERVRGAALAAALSVPVLGRAWQMLLKGVNEIDGAPDRREAAEMVLIRLCHVADMPTPAELVRQLQGEGPGAVASPVALPPLLSGAAMPDRTASAGQNAQPVVAAVSPAAVSPVAVPVAASPAGPGPGADPADGVAPNDPRPASGVVPALTAEAGPAAGSSLLPDPMPQPAGPDAPGNAPGDASGDPDGRRSLADLATPARDAPAASDLARPVVSDATIVPATGEGSLPVAGASLPSDGSARRLFATGPGQRPVVVPSSVAGPVVSAAAGSASLAVQAVSGGGVLRAPVHEPGPAYQPSPVQESAPAEPASVPDPAEPPVLRSWREVVAFVNARRLARLHGNLMHCAHLVRFRPPVIELALESGAPRELSQQLAAVLLAATGTRWSIVVVRDESGEPTLAQQAGLVQAVLDRDAGTHPLVQAILTAFPGAVVGPVSDRSLDEYYALPPEQDGSLLDEVEPPPAEPPDMEFAPEGSEPVGPDDIPTTFDRE